MSENTTESFIIDVDLTSVETSMPVLQAGLYDLRIASLTKEENKDKTGDNLKVKFLTVDPAVSTQGKDLAPGVPLFVYYPLQKKEGGKESNFDWKTNLASLQEAALGEKRVQFATAELIGLIVRATVKVEPYAGSDSNKIAKLSQAI